MSDLFGERSPVESTVIEKLIALAEPVARAEGCSLFDLELKMGKGSSILRVYIDKNGGVGVEDCANVSRQLGFLLDTEDVIPGAYTLEVSSPGLTRALKKPSDFQKAQGKLAAVTSRAGGPGGAGGKFVGIIETAEEGKVALRLKTGELITLAMTDIKKANLEIEPGI